MRSITFDGASSNIANNVRTICEKLGAQLRQINVEKILSYFIHPADKSKCIFIFYDACHIKLVGNASGKEDIMNKDRNVISWKYITELVK